MTNIFTPTQHLDDLFVYRQPRRHSEVLRNLVMMWVLCSVLSDLATGGEATSTCAREWRELLCWRKTTHLYGSSNTPQLEGFSLNFLANWQNRMHSYLKSYSHLLSLLSNTRSFFWMRQQHPSMQRQTPWSRAPSKNPSRTAQCSPSPIASTLWWTQIVF